MLPASSSHSKLIKSGVIVSLLRSTLDKFCYHFGSDSIYCLMSCSQKAVYSYCLFCKLLGFANGLAHPPVPQKGKLLHVYIPYCHSLSHNILAAARSFNIQVMFSSVVALSLLLPSYRTHIVAFLTKTGSCPVYC